MSPAFVSGLFDVAAVSAQGSSPSRHGQRSQSLRRAGSVAAATRSSFRRRLSHGRALKMVVSNGVRTELEEDVDTEWLEMTRRAAEVAEQRAKAARRTTIKEGMDDEDMGLPLDYDVNAIATYWDARPLQVQQRVLQVLSQAAPFAAKYMFLNQFMKDRVNRAEFARDLRNLLTSLGPAFIKLGQGLSVRPDLIGPEVMEELQELCDNVPCFDNQLARDIIREELGADADDLFEGLGNPIAAASLGQVYKCKIRATGKTIALKVQRPDLTRKVSLDLYLLRKMAGFVTTGQNDFTANRTDFVSLADNWASGTYKELDYINEGRNAVCFAEFVKDQDDVVVPDVCFEYTGRKVLAMEWLDGVKLADAPPEDIRRLVGKGVNCFLNQLLEYGLFHADPHGGNLMCTKDGKLCILDFGLMSVIQKREMNAMVASIIHLANRDYPRVVDDFIELAFLPPDVDRAAVTPVLGAVLDQALQGGGAKNVNFQSLSKELSQITFSFPFSIPPYFALLIRALSVLEGIALKADPEFKLIMEAYPYIAQRVLTDKSATIREVLQDILYRDGVFSPARLQTLVESAQGFLGEGEAFVDFDTPSNNMTAQETLEFLFSSEGEFLRDIISEEVANGIDVVVRSIVQQTSEQLERAIPAPLRSLPLVPRLPVVAPLSAADERYLQNLRDLLRFLSQNGVATETKTQDRGLARVTGVERAIGLNAQPLFALLGTSNSMAMEVLTLSRSMPDLFPKIQRMGLQVMGILSERGVRRVFDLILAPGSVVSSSAPFALRRRGRRFHQ
ncbi:Uncharacterized protein FVE85_7181 [Porphyridium purpureum]|uniref:Protein kinase domain-containing protein n=1 Tax=Porphyridium purpureum TaxID=35688 RepID=A0A5J4Z7C1_PORPP|nr:Uncharacterized protein FVE85_7181 [Porphyridium purpureum]|eukprot:POR1727..scf295_1